MSSNASHRFDNAKRRRSDEHDRQAFATPRYLFDPLNLILGGVGLDPCTEPDNPLGADRFYCLPADGAALPWDADTVFCNPPYGEARGRWVDRCIAAGAEGRRVALLIPAHTETRIAQRALAASTTVLFVKARLRFGVLRDNGRQEAASHGSMLCAFGPLDLSPMAPEYGIVMSRYTSPEIVKEIE